MKVLDSAAAAAGAKIGAAAGLGVVGALLLAAVSKEQMTRRDVAARAACAAIGSSVFGDAAVSYFVKSFEWYDAATMTAGTWLLVGALSWGAFGALSELQRVIRERGARSLFDRLFGPKGGDE